MIGVAAWSQGRRWVCRGRGIVSAATGKLRRTINNIAEQEPACGDTPPRTMVKTQRGGSHTVQFAP